MRVIRSGICFAALWVAAALQIPSAAGFAAAHKHPPSSFRLISIKVTGSTRYRPEEVAAATGLQIGQTVTEEDFQRATQKLAGEGVFGEVAYSYQYSGNDARLELKVSDAGILVPARFDDFVWLSDEQLRARLHDEVPLFQGKLPLSGNLTQQVSDALQGLLVEHNVQGQADWTPVATENGPVEALVFKVNGHQVVVRNVEFTGAGPAELPRLQARARRISGQGFSRSALSVKAEKDLLPIYHERGYLKATFGEAQAAVVRETADETDVDITFPVTPGQQYKLAGVELQGEKVWPEAKLRELIRQQPYDTANTVRLEADIDSIKKLYGTRGYVAASVTPKFEMDDAKSTVTYQIRIQEGEVYHLGEVEIQGLDSRTENRVLAQWRLGKDEPYDSSYLARFLDDTFKNVLTTGEWNTTVHELPDPKDKTVDVTVRFDSKTLR